MKKILIIPISILLLTACAGVQTPTEEQKKPEEKIKVETQAIPSNRTSIKEEKTEDGWIREINSERTIGYKGKEVSLKGKVVEEEEFNEWKYFFKISEDSQDSLPEEFVKKMRKENILRYFRLYFEGKDITDNYKGKEMTIALESIGILMEGMPRIDIKQLP